MKKTIITVIISFLLWVPFLAHAATFDMICSDGETGQITIAISCPEEPDGNDVLLAVLRPGMTVEQIELYDDAAGISNILYAKVEGGAARFTYQMNTDIDSSEYDPTGVYTVLASVGGAVVTDNFYYAAKADIEAALKEVAAPSGPLPEAYQLVKDALGLDDAFYQSLKANGTIVLSNYFGVSYNSASEAAEKFKELVAVQAVNEAKSVAEMRTLMERANDVLQFPTGEEDAYRVSLSDDSREAVLYSVVNETGYTDMAQIRTAFENAVLFEQIVHIDSYGALVPLLKANQGALQIDFDEYDKVSKKNEVAIYFLEHYAPTVETLSDVKTAFEACAKRQYDKEHTTVSGNKGGTGGSGGGGGGGNVIKVPAVEPNTDLIPVDGKAPLEWHDVEFHDLDGVAWAREAILTLASYGLINGKGAGIFSPNDAVTREEFVKILMTAMNAIDSGASCTFSDVTVSDYFYKSVASAVNAGIINGMDDATFGTGVAITRQDIATICVRAAESLGASLPVVKEQVVFADASDISGYAVESVKAMQRAGIINGKDNNRFAPLQSATRAEAAKMVYGFCTALGLL